MYNFLNTGNRIAWLVGLISVLMSFWFFAGNNWPNTDGILYLRGAKAFLEHGFYAAADYFPNPVYSILIGTLSSITHLELTTSAYLINAFFCGIIGFLIVDVTRLLTDRVEPSIYAGLLFLLHPTFNEYRDFIVRDFVFWAAILGFIDCHIRFNLFLQKRMLAAGLVFLLIGSLFRTEALVFILAPVVSLFSLRKHPTLLRISVKFWTGLLTVLATLCVITFFYLDTQQKSVLENILLLQLQHILNIGTTFTNLVQNFNQHILIGYLDEYTPVVLFAAIFTLLILKTINTLTWPYLIAFFVLRHSITQVRFSLVRVLPLRITWIICATMLFIYLLATRVLQGRHTLLLILLLLPAMGAYLEHWLTHARRSGSKTLSRRRILAIALFIYLLLDGFVSFGSQKVYLQQSADWLKTHIPNDCKVVANNTKIAFFSEREILWKATEAWAGTPQLPADVWLTDADIVVREYRKKWHSSSLFSESISDSIQPVLLQHFEDEDNNGVEIYALDPASHCATLTR